MLIVKITDGYANREESFSSIKEMDTFIYNLAQHQDFIFKVGDEEWNKSSEYLKNNKKEGEKMKQNVEVEKYHYLKTRRGKVPIVTVCVVKQGEEYARGFSVLSFRDKLDLREGKRHARASALQALGTKKSGKEIVRNDAFDMLDLVDITPYRAGKKLYKAQYKPVLTKHEKLLLGGI